MPDWSHGIAGSDLVQQLQWTQYTLLGIARGELPFVDHGVWSHLGGYAQLGAGLGIGHTHLDGADGMVYRSTYGGPAVSAATGLRVELHHVGVGGGFAYDYAPVIKDLIGNTHASGGLRLTFGVDYSF
jgi:hypothetical protein